MGIANYITMLNGIASFLAILLVSYDYRISIILIYVSFVGDILDGKVARMLNETSEFGKNLDTLSDLISFGIAPMYILFSIVQTNIFVYIILSFYMMCVLYRLARFNVGANATATKTKTHFEGLPAHYPTIIMITLLWFISPIYIIYLSVPFALLMVSKIKIPNFF